MPTDVETRAPWERLETESVQAYTAFCAYRDMGPRRSIDAAYRRHKTGRESDEPHQVASRVRAVGRWNQWRRDYRWKERAEAYDLHLESESRKMRETKHFEQLEEHLERQRKIAVQTSLVSLNLLRILAAELQTSVGDNAAGRHLVTPRNFASIARTAAILAKTGLESEGNALGIEEIIARLMES